MVVRPAAFVSRFASGSGFATASRWAATSLLGLASLSFIAPAAPLARAADFTVTNPNDDGSSGTLRWAIEQANAAGAGNHTISFSVPANSQIQLADDLPQLDNPAATIELDGVGAGRVTISGQDNHRVLFVNSGNWVVRNVNIVHGSAQGGNGGVGGGSGGGGLGAGGAVFVNSGASLTVQNVGFQDNHATGGDAGVGTGSVSRGGGGGGGLAGDGGNGVNGDGGGGGGGLRGDGGNTGASGGGGGGGLLLPGGNGIGSIGGIGALFGGDGGNQFDDGEDGFVFGGGGGGGRMGSGGDGGAFGGGGGAGGNSGFTAGNGGFGGGGGGGSSGSIPGQGGFGAGDGGANSMGNGGSGFGGAVFVRDGGSFTVIESNTADNGVASGFGAQLGDAAGQDLYLMSGVQARFRGTNEYTGSIAGGGLLHIESGTTTLSGANSYAGGTTVDSGATLNGDSTSLQGDITVHGTVDFQQTTSGTYGGQLSGGGGGLLVKSEQGILSLTNENNFVSEIHITDGALSGTTSSLAADQITNDGTLVYDQDSDGVSASLITGGGNLAKLGTGTVEILGVQQYTGRTDIMQGGLTVNGTITSETWVGADGRLNGNGIIDGDLHNFGRVAAGNSIGTLSVTGDYTSMSSSVLEVEINDAGTTPGVNNDLLEVDGDANLQGGTVQVIAESGNYTAGTTYRFLSAGSILGSFGSVTVTGLDPGLHAVLGYDEFLGLDWAFFTILTNQTDFALVAQTFNERQMAYYLDDESYSSTGLLRDVLDQMEMMTPAEQRYALNQLTAVANPTMAQLNVLDNAFLYMMLRRRVGSAYAAGGAIESGSSEFAANDDSGAGLILPVSYNGSSTSSLRSCSSGSRGPCWSGWMSGYGFGGSAQSDGNAAGGVYGSGGSIVALERALDSSTLVGFFGAYSHLGLSLNTLPQNASADQGLFGVYALKSYERDYWLGAASAGFAGYRETRQINIGNTSATANGDYSGWNPTAYLEYGRRYNVGRTSIQPYLAGQYVYVRQNGFTETGAGDLNQQIGGVDTNALRGFLGARAAQAWRDNSGRVWIPELRAVWMHEFLQPDTTLTAVFAPIGGSSFETRGLDFGRDWAVLGAGTQYVLTSNISLFANYDVLMNSQTVWNAGSGGLQFAW